MGIKGDKMSESSVVNAEELLEKLDGIEGLTTKKMFGGHGLFHEARMFGLIDSRGKAFLKADPETAKTLIAKGSIQHSRMPYYSVTRTMWNSSGDLVKAVKLAIQQSK